MPQSRLVLTKIHSSQAGSLEPHGSPAGSGEDSPCHSFQALAFRSSHTRSPPPRCLRLSSQGGPTLRILGPRREPQPQASPPRAASSLPTASLHFRWGRGSLRAQLSEIRKPPSGKGGLRLGKGRTGLAQVSPWAGRSGHAALRPPPALTEGRPRLPHSILRPLLGARVPPRGGPTDPRHVIHVACSNWPA